MELNYLYVLLFVAFVLAPLSTNSLFLHNAKSYQIGHATAFLFVFLGLVSGINLFFVAWLLFCCFGFFLYTRQERTALLSVQGIATFIPFVFSIIASVWLVAGTNDLQLLGYNKHWSFYAALHGNYLGWMFLGCLASLSKTRKTIRSLFSAGCYICLILFLLVAFGIDGIPYVKRIGVIGLTIVVPFFILLFLRTTRDRLSMSLAILSLLGIFFTLSLAVINEFWVLQPQSFLGARSMVSLHGMVNGLIVLPSFCLAVWREKRA